MSARELLKIYGMQVTMPRILVIEDLMNNRFHATADEIRLNYLDFHLVDFHLFLLIRLW